MEQSSSNERTNTRTCLSACLSVCRGNNVEALLARGLPVPREDGPDVGDEPEGVEDGQQVEQGSVGGVVEPGLDRDGVVWKTM